MADSVNRVAPLSTRQDLIGAGYLATTRQSVTAGGASGWDSRTRIGMYVLVISS